MLKTYFSAGREAPGKGVQVFSTFVSLTFLLSINSIAHAQQQPAQQQTTAPSALNQSKKSNSCEVLSISNPNEILRTFLEKLENSIRSNNIAEFYELLHPALIRTETEKTAEFNNMMSSYELKGKNLQRNFIYQLEFSDSPHEVLCRKHRITGVVGPTKQWAVEYSTVTNKEQVRLSFLFAAVPAALAKRSKHPIGIVYLNTQNWSFAGNTPGTLFDEAKKWDLLGEPLASWVFGTAAKRIVQSNAYFFDTSYQANLDDLNKTAEKKDALLKEFIGKAIEKTSFTIKDFTTVFKEARPEFGVKVEVDRELPVNDQIKDCKELTRFLAPTFFGAKQTLTGLECMIYKKNEPLEKIPRYGTIFTSFKEALRD